jgi:hypothetical protein
MRAVKAVLSALLKEYNIGPFSVGGGAMRTG